MLDTAPLGLGNLARIYNPQFGTLDQRINLAQLDDPADFICSMLLQANQPLSTCSTVKGVLDLLGQAAQPRPRDRLRTARPVRRWRLPRDGRAAEPGPDRQDPRRHRRRPAMRRRTGVVAGVVALAVLLSGCDFSVYSLPLPGGAKIKGPAITVTVEFSDVLDLVPKSSVKVDDVTVGTVEKVWLEGYVAKVRLKLPKSVELPDNARATIRQTSLLGEKFVSLAPPTGRRAAPRPARRRRADPAQRGPPATSRWRRCSLRCRCC